MARDRELAEIPARVAAGERVVLRPSKRRKLGSLVLGLWAGFFAGAGLATLGQGVVGLIVIVPATPLALYWLAVAMPRSSALTLDRTGFQVRHAWITRRWDWDRVRGFGVRHVFYNTGGGIDLVSFATPDPREQPGDMLQQLAIRGVTRTSTLPDRFGEDPVALAEAMSQCRQRFSDRQVTDDPAALDADVARSTMANAVALVALIVVMTAGSLFLALAGDDTFNRAIGWMGVALFGVGGAISIVMRSRRWRRERSFTPKEVDADVEVDSTAGSSGESKETVARVLDAHYDYLERQPRDRPIDRMAEQSQVARETGLDEETVGRVFDAHDEFLTGAGLMKAP